MALANKNNMGSIAINGVITYPIYQLTSTPSSDAYAMPTCRLKEPYSTLIIAKCFLFWNPLGTYFTFGPQCTYFPLGPLCTMNKVYSTYTLEKYISSIIIA